MTPDTQKIFIVELAEQVHRRPATIRQWDRMGILPKAARPQRNDRGWRYWTPDQVPMILDWMKASDLRPGKGLAHYNPSREEVDAHIEGQRLPRDPVSVALRKGLITEELAERVRAGELPLDEARTAAKADAKAHAAA